MGPLYITRSLLEDIGNQVIRKRQCDDGSRDGSDVAVSQRK